MHWVAVYLDNELLKYLDEYVYHNSSHMGFVRGHPLLRPCYLKWSQVVDDLNNRHSSLSKSVIFLYVIQIDAIQILLSMVCDVINFLHNKIHTTIILCGSQIIP